MQDQLAYWARTWHLDIDTTQSTPTSLVAFGRRAGTPVVLKVVRPGLDEWHSGPVLAAFQGRGMVRALEVGTGAVLLECLSPGTPLAALSLNGRDDEATRILAELLGQLEGPATLPGCPTLHQWAQAFDRYLSSTDPRVPRAIVERGQAWYLALVDTQRKPRLLHGDLQHYNVLTDSARGWVAIDPKGVIGEPEYETGACLRNPVEQLTVFTTPAAVERRIRVFASTRGWAPDRLVGWAYAQAVLSAVWCVEDGTPLAPEAPLFQLITTVCSMLPPWP